jgi:hypothetical protein
MHIRLHDLPNVVSGMLVYPFSEAKSVLRRYADLVPSMPDELTVQIGAVAGPDGVPVIMLVPTWSGAQGQGDQHIAPLLGLGTLLDNTLDAVRYGTSLSVFDQYIVKGQRTIMEACSRPALDGASVDLLVEAMAKAVSAGCAVFSHEFRGAAPRVPVEATAFGLRRDHAQIEIPLRFDGRTDWKSAGINNGCVTRGGLRIALPGGYPNLLASVKLTVQRKALVPTPTGWRVKQFYDPECLLFRHPLPLVGARSPQSTRGESRARPLAPQKATLNGRVR